MRTNHALHALAAASCALLLALSATPYALAQDADAPPDTPPPAQPDAPQPSARREPSPEEIKIARQTAGDGLDAYKAGEYAKALNLFEQARAVYPSAQILRMTGYSHLALQHWEQAVQTLRDALASTVAPLSEQDRADVQEQLNKALAHFGMVTVTTSVKGAEVSVDDGPARKLPLDQPLRLLEGGHRIEVRAPGHKDAAEDLVIEGGKELQLTLNPKPVSQDAPPPPPPPRPAPKPEPGWGGVRIFPAQREIGLVVAGTGVALGAATLVTALVGADLRGDVEQDVQTHQESFGPNCERGGYRLCVFDRAVINHDADRADTLRDASVWMGIGAGAMFAIGTTLFLIAPDGPLAAPPQEPQVKEAAPRTSLRCSPVAGGLTCAGLF
jgi:hypothetical protein